MLHNDRWLFPYHEEPRTAGAHFLPKPLMRRAVWAQFASHADEQTEKHKALVDSGCDHILAADWLAHSIGVTPDADREMSVRIGGATRSIRFAEVTIKLFGAGPSDLAPADGDSLIEWRADVGFWSNWGDPPWTMILGQCGFFDQFTIAMSRHAQCLAVLDERYFDENFGSLPQTSGRESRTRFTI